MKNLPVNASMPVFERNLLPSKAAIVSTQEQPQTEAVNTEASVVSLPRGRTPAALQDVEAGKALQSLLSSADNSKELLAAHSGLEVSRVFDLLSD